MLRSLRTAASRVATPRAQRRLIDLPTNAMATKRSLTVVVQRLLVGPQIKESSLSDTVNSRAFASLSEGELKKRLDEFQDLFVEARLSIEDCQDSAGTKYFDEEAEAAMEAVDDAVKAFEKIIEDLDDNDQKNRVLRGNGLKVEQLKGELEVAVKGGDDH